MVGGRSAVAALSPSEREHYRRLAWKLFRAGETAGKAERFMKRNNEGFVYVISHPSWEGALKIGRACDPQQRLSAYQTGCPSRAYQLEACAFFLDCKFAEAELHARLDDYRLRGEWFNLSVELAVDSLYQLRETL